MHSKKKVKTSAGEIAYVDEGQGPAAVFVHGVFLSSRLWQDVIDGVSDIRRCVAIDLPGHGASAQTDRPIGVGDLADIVEEVRVALDLDAVDLIGNDTGGAVCQVFAGRHPERIRSLVLTNCDTQGNLPPANFAMPVELARQGQLAPVLTQMSSDPELARGPMGLGSGLERPEDLTEDDLAEYLGPFRTLEGAAVLERMVAAMDDAELVAVEPVLKGLEAPTLIAWGTGDAFFELSWGEWLRDTIPNARLETIEGAKLFYPHERGADLVPLLRRFWA